MSHFLASVSAADSDSVCFFPPHLWSVALWDDMFGLYAALTFSFFHSAKRLKHRETTHVPGEHDAVRSDGSLIGTIGR